MSFQAYSSPPKHGAAIVNKAENLAESPQSSALAPDLDDASAEGDVVEGVELHGQPHQRHARGPSEVDRGEGHAGHLEPRHGPDRHVHLHGAHQGAFGESLRCSRQDQVVRMVEEFHIYMHGP